MAVKSDSFLEKMIPVLLLATIGLAFGVGVLWQKVRVLEKGAVSGATTGANAAGGAAAQPTLLPVDIKNVDTKGEPFIGKEDAPVTIAYWSDYQCPFCQKFEQETLPEIISEYVDTGKVKIVFKDFEFLGSDSTTGALAEHAVWEVSPQNFIKWQLAMYDEQDAENAGWGNKNDIIALTKTVSGVDANKVSQLMDSKQSEYQKEADADKVEGAKFNVTGTPGFVIGKQSIFGAQPISVFKQLIDAELAK
jgi:protein-disulfide isomerase